VAPGGEQADPAPGGTGRSRRARRASWCEGAGGVLASFILTLKLLPRRKREAVAEAIVPQAG
jgi:hypothetical protein